MHKTVTGGIGLYCGIQKKEFQGQSLRRSFKRQWQDLLEHKEIVYTLGEWAGYRVLDGGKEEAK